MYHSSKRKQPKHMPPPPPPKPIYRYGFTNSEFFAFLISLTPVELTIFEAVLSVVVQLNLNSIETRLLGSFIFEVAATVGNIAEQERFRKALFEEATAAQEDNVKERVQALEQQVILMQQLIEELRTKK